MEHIENNIGIQNVYFKAKLEGSMKQIQNSFFKLYKEEACDILERIVIDDKRALLTLKAESLKRQEKVKVDIDEIASEVIERFQRNDELGLDLKVLLKLNSDTLLELFSMIEVFKDKEISVFMKQSDKAFGHLNLRVFTDEGILYEETFEAYNFDQMTVCVEYAWVVLCLIRIPLQNIYS